MKAKIGELRQYWAYIGKSPEKPVGYENETQWHYNWKSLVNDENCEVIFGQNKEHRADIVGNNGRIIEIQLSTIDIRIVRERVEFYKKHSFQRIVWVVDATKYFNKTLQLKEKNGGIYKAIWKNKRQWTFLLAKTTDCDLFLDINHKGNYLLKTWVYDNEICCSYFKKTQFYFEHQHIVGQCKTNEQILERLTRVEK